MGKLGRLCALVVCFFPIVSEASAQNASMVPADLKFTQEISTQFHIAASVTLQLHDGSTEKFQYDRYPYSGLHSGVERIKRSEGVFARPSGEMWVHSDDWGETGSAVDENMTRVLETDVNVVATPFRPPTNRDSRQGGAVWRYVDSTSQGTATKYTFEESREHPKPDVAYPRYTFLKAPHDTDGRLFLCDVAANLRDNAETILLKMQLTYLVTLPPGTKVQVYDKNTGKEKLNTITGSKSGWEITSQTSEPPAPQ